MPSKHILIKSALRGQTEIHKNFIPNSAYLKKKSHALENKACDIQFESWLNGFLNNMQLVSIR